MSDVLSVDGSDADFSGFSAVESPTKAVVSTKNVDKSKIKTYSKKGKKSKASTNAKSSTSKTSVPKKLPDQNAKASTSKSNLLDSMSASDLEQLREALGISRCESNTRIVEPQATEFEQTLGNLDSLPNIHVSLDRDDVSGEETELFYPDFPSQPSDHLNRHVHTQDNAQLGPSGFQDALFAEELSDSWELPQLKIPDKGEAVSSNLAQLINTACTVPCDTDVIVGKYKLPQNCSSLGAPLVNSEIWKIMERRSRSQDRGLADIQNLLSVGMIPVIKLADILKSQIQTNMEAKTLMSDLMTIIGQVQYQISLRRRYLIRPNINKKYTNLCNVSTPISDQLFGADISKEIRSCEAGVSLGKDSYRQPRGRGYGRPYRIPRRGGYNQGSGYNQDYGNRYAPYSQRGSNRGNRPYNQRGRRAPPS